MIEYFKVEMVVIQILIIALFSGCNINASRTKSTFTNERNGRHLLAGEEYEKTCNGISTFVPEKWEIHENSGHHTFLTLKAHDKSKYSFRSFVNFSKKKFNMISLESYYSILIQSLNKNTSTCNVKLLSKENVQIQSNTGIRFTYIATIISTNTSIKSRITLLTNNGALYSIDCTSPSESYNKNLQTFKKIENSFRINE